MRLAGGDLRTQYEYHKARLRLLDDVADSYPDQDDGIHIRGPRKEDHSTDSFHTDWIDSDQTDANNPVRRSSGRIAPTWSPDYLITKKLVVITVLIVNVFCTAGAAIIFGPSCGP